MPSGSRRTAREAAARRGVLFLVILSFLVVGFLLVVSGFLFVVFFLFVSLLLVVSSFLFVGFLLVSSSLFVGFPPFFTNFLCFFCVFVYVLACLDVVVAHPGGVPLTGHSVERYGRFAHPHFVLGVIALHRPAWRPTAVAFLMAVFNMINRAGRRQRQRGSGPDEPNCNQQCLLHGLITSHFKTGRSHYGPSTS